MRQITIPALLVALAALAPLHAGAAAITVLPGDGTWTSGGNTGGGSSAITGTAPRSGGGSVELFGDRTRFTSAPADYGLLNNVQSLVYDWRIAQNSVAQLNADYTPALRLLVVDSGVFSELIWEGAYNGTYGSTSKDTWYTTDATDVFWRSVAGVPGSTVDAGAQVNLTLQDWEDDANSGGTQWYTDAARVYGFSIGVGSSAGTQYHAFADNVVFTTKDGNRTTSFNFELRADVNNGVPEPSSMALAGLALFGLAAARRRTC